MGAPYRERLPIATRVTSSSDSHPRFGVLEVRHDIGVALQLRSLRRGNATACRISMQVKLHTVAALTTGEVNCRKLVEESLSTCRVYVAVFRLSSARLYMQTVASHYCELTHCGVTPAAYAADSVISTSYTWGARHVALHTLLGSGPH
jgi:hypothetical protein